MTKVLSSVTAAVALLLSLGTAGAVEHKPALECFPERSNELWYRGPAGDITNGSSSNVSKKLYCPLKNVACAYNTSCSVSAKVIYTDYSGTENISCKIGLGSPGGNNFWLTSSTHTSSQTTLWGQSFFNIALSFNSGTVHWPSSPW